MLNNLKQSNERGLVWLYDENPKILIQWLEYNGRNLAYFSWLPLPCQSYLYGCRSHIFNSTRTNKYNLHYRQLNGFA